MKFTKETLRRSLRTAFQAAVVYICTALTQGVDFDTWKQWVPPLFAGALGAGIGAVMNLESKELTL